MMNLLDAVMMTPQFFNSHDAVNQLLWITQKK